MTSIQLMAVGHYHCMMKQTVHDIVLDHGKEDSNYKSLVSPNTCIIYTGCECEVIIPCMYNNIMSFVQCRDPFVLI